MSLLFLVYVTFFLSLNGILLLFLYPLFLFSLSIFFKKEHMVGLNELPPVSLIVAVHNGEDLVEDKIRNSISLHYPEEKLEVIISSDGSTDRTEEIVKRYEGKGVRLVSLKKQEGKAAALNKAVEASRGEILLFSDVDAILDEDCIHKMVRHYGDPGIGGVCGLRVIHEGSPLMRSAQRFYVGFDSLIKILETRIDSITSNDGKVYSIRRSLFRPIDRGATDDLYTCLSVVSQEYRFIFDPEARAYIRLPSRDPSHEVRRRRRIVARSLRGIYLMKEVLNPIRYGFYSIGLAINKVIRRGIPLFLILFFTSSGVLGIVNPLIRIFWLLQAAGYLLALLYYPLSKIGKRPGLFMKIPSALFYFTIGAYGTLLGLMDFFTGREVYRWEPIKKD